MEKNKSYSILYYINFVIKLLDKNLRTLMGKNGFEFLIREYSAEQSFIYQQHHVKEEQRKIYNEMIKDVNVSQTELLPEIKNYNLNDKISAAGIKYDGIDINQLPEFLKLINIQLRTGL